MSTLLPLEMQGKKYFTACRNENCYLCRSKHQNHFYDYLYLSLALLHQGLFLSENLSRVEQLVCTSCAAPSLITCFKRRTTRYCNFKPAVWSSSLLQAVRQITHKGVITPCFVQTLLYVSVWSELKQDVWRGQRTPVCLRVVLVWIKLNHRLVGWKRENTFWMVQLFQPLTGGWDNSSSRRRRAAAAQGAEINQELLQLL